jgi:deoxyribodipyrimidine photo-lyase
MPGQMKSHIAKGVLPASAPQLIWLRRDLRLTDHAALHAALAQPHPVVLVFVFDTTILEPLRAEHGLAQPIDRRLGFIHASLQAIDDELKSVGSRLVCGYGPAGERIAQLAQALGACRVISAQDYEPAAIARDLQVAQSLKALGADFVQVKDQTVFQGAELLTGAGRPFSVFTPYKKAWLRTFEPSMAAERATRDLPARVLPAEILAAAGLQAQNSPLAQSDRPADWGLGLPSLGSMGFSDDSLKAISLEPAAKGAQLLLRDFETRAHLYQEARDFPAVKGPSYLSTHLRFGTISLRECVRKAIELGAELSPASDGSGSAGPSTWLSELIWREFYMQILANFPHVVNASFKPAYDQLAWNEGPKADHDFAAWCEGQTGYPIVDAGMRQLNQTGYMHNRLRMIVASFLTKDLGIHWLRGERYFALKLNDYDLSANNGGWQWAASTGCDAQPYFRIFNPTSQSERFDPKGQFLARYLPELAGLPEKKRHAPWLAGDMTLGSAGVELGRDYPLPLVDHDQARKATLARFAVLKQAAN